MNLYQILFRSFLILGVCIFYEWARHRKDIGIPFYDIDKHVIPKRIIVTHSIDLCDVNTSNDSSFDLIFKNIAKMRSLNAGYQLECYNDSEAFSLISDFDNRLARHFENEKVSMYKADIFRIVALYLRGGFYSDADLDHLIPLDELMSDYKNTSFITAISKSDQTIFQAFIGVVKNHPVLRLALTEYRNFYDEMEDWGESTHQCNKFIEAKLGPCLMKIALETFFGSGLYEIAEEELSLLVEHKPRGRYVLTSKDNSKTYFNSRFAGYVNALGWMEVPP